MRRLSTPESSSPYQPLATTLRPLELVSYTPPLSALCSFDSGGEHTGGVKCGAHLTPRRGTSHTSRRLRALPTAAADAAELTSSTSFEPQGDPAATAAVLAVVLVVVVLQVRGAAVERAREGQKKAMAELQVLRARRVSETITPQVLREVEQQVRTSHQPVGARHGEGGSETELPPGLRVER